MSLNVGAVFIILVAGTIGTAMPIIAKHKPRLLPGPFVFTMGKHVGTGVIIALSLIHLLTPAYYELGNPCLPKAWSVDYQYAPLFCMLASLAMHFIETIVHLKYTKEEKECAVHQDDELVTTKPSIVHHHDHHHALLLDKKLRNTISAYIMEFGLTTHSVIIGITVGVAGKGDLGALIPALFFHQFFEGVALGARLADADFSSFNEFLLTFIYSTSCPIGIGIGIGIHLTYNTNAVTTNLVQGSFDSISAGILLYVGYVQMLSVEFMKDVKAASTGARKWALFWCMWLGAGVMALIGKWL